MSNRTDPPPATADPADSVWQEYPISLVGDGLRAVTVLLVAVAAGCALAFGLNLVVQIAFAGLLTQWIPAEDLEALGIATMLVSMLTAVLALAVAMFPGWLAGLSTQRALLAALRDGAPRTRVPHPVQQTQLGGGYWGSMSVPVSVLVATAAAVYLLVRIIMDPSHREYWLYGAIVLGYVLLAAGLFALLHLLGRRAVRRHPQLHGRKKPRGVGDLCRTYWSKTYRSSVLSKAARAAGYDSIGDARRVAKKADAEETRKHSSRLRPPQVGGGAPPLPTSPGANLPEWALRDQPRAMSGAIRLRWGALLVVWAGLLGGAFLSRALFGDDAGADQDLGASTIAVAAVMGAMLVAVLVALGAEVALAVLRTRERAQLFAAAADPAAQRPAEGALIRGSAPRTLGLARAGALLVGVALPFVIAAMEATGDEGSFFMEHADAVTAVLWGCIAFFAGWVLLQTVEYRYGRHARNRVQARWPSLWPEKYLSSW